MSLPTYQAIGTAALAVSVTAPDDYLSLTCNWPTHQTNDIGIFVIYDDSSAIGAEIDPGGGWTLIDNGNDGSARIKAFWKRAASNSEGAAGFSTGNGLPVGSSAANAYGVIITYRGCVPTGDPINVTANTTRTTSTSCTFPSITTTEADTMVLLLASRDNDNAAAAWSAITNAALGSITERFDAGITNGNGGGFLIAEGTKATAGVVGTTSSTVTSSAGGMITFALRGIVPAGIIGSTTLSLATSGNLTGNRFGSGSTTLTFATTGTLTKLSAIAGSATVTLATTGSLKGAGKLSGATTVTLATAANLAIIPVSMPLSGVARLSFNTQGTVIWNQGSTSITFNVTGILGARVPIQGETSLALTTQATATRLASIAGSSTLALAITGVLRNSSRVIFNKAFLDVYAARMALLTKIDYQTNLILENSLFVVNGGFENSSIGWTLDSGWSTEVNAISLTGTKLAKKVGGGTTGKILNAGKISVSAGKRIIAVAYVRSSSANGLIGAGVKWYNQAGTEITPATESITTAPASCEGVWLQARCTCIAPANAAWARVFADVSGHTTGTWYVDNLDIEVTPQDATNLNPVNIGSVSSLWNGMSISYTVPTTGSPATCTINVSSGTLQAGAVTVSYNASTADVVQARSTTVRYYLYYLDAGFTGGTKTLNVTTSALDIANSNAVLWIGTVDVVVATLGTGGSGTGPPAGGGGDTSLIQ